jgi:biotin operon repressor
VSARSLAEIALGLPPAKRVRSFQPVRRDSFEAGDRESSVWKPLGRNRSEARKLIAISLTAAERYDRAYKEAGKRNGPLGHVGLEVLRKLYSMADYRTGRVDPSIATICEQIGRSRTAVVRAQTRLREHGFLIWIRRSLATGSQGKGPQVRQITNAYGFALPASAAEWVRKSLDDGPVPACEAERQDGDRRLVKAMLAEATLDEFIDFTVGEDSEASASLKRIGALVARNASPPSGQNPYQSLF